MAVMRKIFCNFQFECFNYGTTVCTLCDNNQLFSWNRCLRVGRYVLCSLLGAACSLSMNTLILLHINRQWRCSTRVPKRKAIKIKHYKTVTIEINCNISIPYPSERVCVVCGVRWKCSGLFPPFQLVESVPKSHTQ
jgi:hypothetical protein